MNKTVYIGEKVFMNYAKFDNEIFWIERNGSIHRSYQGAQTTISHAFNTKEDFNRHIAANWIEYQGIIYFD